jgi:hypothetical protein
VYGGGDADRYFGAGVELARQIPVGEAVFGEISGTRFTEVLSGYAYIVLPDSQLAGFFLFAWIAFLGVLLCTRAVRIALPNADHRRYDVLAFFLPTLVFWPSSLGKETWMVAMIGLSAYGVARVLTHRPSGVIPLGLGVWGAAAVRPHIALMILAPLAPAWLLRPAGRNRLGLSPFLRGLGVVAVILVALVLVTEAEEFFDIDSLNREGAEQVAEDTALQTAQGGSEFENQAVSSPLDIPGAAVTVFARPFLWEVSSAQAAASAVEGLVLIALMVYARRELWALPRNLLRQPYLLYCAVFTLVFVVAYSAINNFGILVRQRAQLFPIFLVLLLPIGKSPETATETEPASEPEPERRNRGRRPGKSPETATETEPASEPEPERRNRGRRRRPYEWVIRPGGRESQPAAR